MDGVVVVEIGELAHIGVLGLVVDELSLYGLPLSFLN
jgi:hypothetical protein